MSKPELQHTYIVCINVRIPQLIIIMTLLHADVIITTLMCVCVCVCVCMCGYVV